MQPGGGFRAKGEAPIWRRDEETGRTYALKLTAAGVKAIVLEDSGPSEVEAKRRTDIPAPLVDPKVNHGSDRAAAVDEPGSDGAASPLPPRRGTKIAQVIDLLQGGGATIAELIAATGWLPHTTRAALTGLRKRGYGVGLDRSDQARGSLYRIEPAERREETVEPNLDGPDQIDVEYSRRSRRTA
jgi:hypothetical protein